MPELYVKEFGAYIRKCGDSLRVEKNSKKLIELPLSRIERVNIVGSVQISTQALHALFYLGIDVVFMNYGGRILGVAKSDNSRNIFVKLAHFQAYYDEDFRNQLMRTIVKGKIKNQIVLTRKYLWSHKNHPFENILTQLEETLCKIDNANRREELLGLEGSSSAKYFKVFSAMLKKNFSFELRTKRPAKDPVNAILNLGYTILANRMASILESIGFEVQLGFLHGICMGRKSLAFDMIEEFRQPLIDRFTLYVLNKGIIRIDHFQKQKDGAFILTEEGFSIFWDEFSKYSEVRVFKNDNTYLKCMQEQCLKLKESVMNGNIYEPFELSI
ncbi:UNVERIFIED_CONTAM: CRISPR-associated protein Cas1 [Acetivibrio alkalicellulosi]